MIIQLIRPKCPGAAADLARCFDHLLDQRFGDLLVVAPHNREIRTERAHRQCFLLAEGVGKDDLQWIAFGRADERKRHAGCSSRVLDDGTARPQPSIRFRGVDGGTGHPIFHAAGGIRRFELGHNPSGTGRHDFPKLHERRVADRPEHVCSEMNHSLLQSTPSWRASGRAPRRSA